MPRSAGEKENSEADNSGHGITHQKSRSHDVEHTCTQKEPFECKHCGKCFPASVNLKKHEKNPF